VIKRARVRATRVMEMMMRVAGNKEGKGSKVMASVTKVVGEWTAAAAKRAMATKTRFRGAGGGNDRPLGAT
jgi:hypothetical protein